MYVCEEHLSFKNWNIFFQLPNCEALMAVFVAKILLFCFPFDQALAPKHTHAHRSNKAVNFECCNVPVMIKFVCILLKIDFI